MLSRSADSDAVYAQGRLADSDRDALAILAAGANPGIKLEVVADHADPVEVGWAIADQHGSLEGPSKLSILDPVGLGDLDDVFARGDVDLTPTEIGGIDPALNRSDDLARCVRAGKHVGIGHAWHGQMGIALSAAIASGFHAHETCILAVLHVANEDAVFDQHCAAGRGAFVIDR